MPDNPSTGSGPDFGTPNGFGVQADGQLVCTDLSLMAVLGVDPVSGARKIISDASTGTGPNFVAPLNIAVQDGSNLLVVDTGLRAVIFVDAANGNRGILSDANTGSGPDFQPFNIAIETTEQIVCTDFSLLAVVRVNPEYRRPHNPIECRHRQRPQLRCADWHCDWIQRPNLRRRQRAVGGGERRSRQRRPHHRVGCQHRQRTELRGAQRRNGGQRSIDRGR